MHLDDISLGIITDKALPKLLEAAVKGKVFKKVEIHGTATYGDAGEQVYLALELENVQITNYQLGVLDNDAATDDLSLVAELREVQDHVHGLQQGRQVRGQGRARVEGRRRRIAARVRRRAVGPQRAVGGAAVSVERPCGGAGEQMRWP